MILRHFRAVCSTGRWCKPNNLRNASEWSDTSTLTLRTLIHFFRRYICFMEIASCWNIIYIPLPRSIEIYDICVLFTWVYRSLIYRIFFSWLFELIVDVFLIFPGIPPMKGIDGGLPHSNPQGPRPRSVAPGFGWLGFKMNFMKRKIGWSVDPKWQTSMDPNVGPYQL